MNRMDNLFSGTPYIFGNGELEMLHDSIRGKTEEIISCTLKENGLEISTVEKQKIISFGEVHSVFENSWLWPTRALHNLFKIPILLNKDTTVHFYELGVKITFPGGVINYAESPLVAHVDAVRCENNHN